MSFSDWITKISYGLETVSKNVQKRITISAEDSHVLARRFPSTVGELVLFHFRIKDFTLDSLELDSIPPKDMGWV